MLWYVPFSPLWWRGLSRKHVECLSETFSAFGDHMIFAFKSVDMIRCIYCRVLQMVQESATGVRIYCGNRTVETEGEFIFLTSVALLLLQTSWSLSKPPPTPPPPLPPLTSTSTTTTNSVSSPIYYAPKWLSELIRNTVYRYCTHCSSITEKFKAYSVKQLYESYPFTSIVFTLF